MAENSAMGGGEIIGGIALGLLNNELARSRESQGRQENFGYNELAAENADKRTRALYNDLMSPESLLKQYKNAGISPSLMFGGGGVGGQVAQGAQGAGVAGINPHTFGIDPVAMAQVNLMNAQAKKTEEEAITEKDLRGATLNKIIAETNNIDLRSAGQRFQNKISDIESQIAQATKDNEIEISTYDLLKADREFLILKEELEQEKDKSKITRETADTIIQEEKQKLINLQVQATLMRAQKQLAESNIQLNKQEIEGIASEISKNVNMVQIEWEKLYYDNKHVEESLNIAAGNLDAKQKSIVAHIITSAMNAGAKMAGK